MSKPARNKPPWILVEDRGRGLSHWPSDNLSALPAAIDHGYMHWIDALHAMDELHDPSKFLDLIAREPVPPAVLPYVADLLRWISSPKKGGRPALLYKDTRNRIAIFHAFKMVRELVAEGKSLRVARAKAAADFGLKPHQLTARDRYTSDIKSGPP